MTGATGAGATSPTGGLARRLARTVLGLAVFGACLGGAASALPLLARVDPAALWPAGVAIAAPFVGWFAARAIINRLLPLPPAPLPPAPPASWRGRGLRALTVAAIIAAVVSYPGYCSRQYERKLQAGMSLEEAQAAVGRRRLAHGEIARLCNGPAAPARPCAELRAAGATQYAMWDVGLDAELIAGFDARGRLVAQYTWLH